MFSLRSILLAAAAFATIASAIPTTPVAQGDPELEFKPVVSGLDLAVEELTKGLTPHEFKNNRRDDLNSPTDSFKNAPTVLQSSLSKLVGGGFFII
jgi:hypothetical protein